MQEAVQLQVDGGLSPRLGGHGGGHTEEQFHVTTNPV